jgi:hypothetical protein
MLSTGARAMHTRTETRPLSPAELLAPAVLLAGALAASGLAELLLQRVVYRVGVHIPRSGAFLEVYEAATWLGDLAFRLTAALLAPAALLLAAHLLRQRSRAILGAGIVALLGLNLLVWPLGVDAVRGAVPILFAGGAAWAVGQSLAGGGPLAPRGAVAAAGAALVLGAYRGGLDAPGAVSAFQLASEAAMLVAAGLLFLAARPSIRGRLPAFTAVSLTGAVVVVFAREPATVAIVSTWASGITLSLPPVLYLGALAAATLAVVAWLRRASTRHLGTGVLLLAVAGLQPQVLHHYVTALMGLALLALGPVSGPPESADGKIRMEVV